MISERTWAASGSRDDLRRLTEALIELDLTGSADHGLATLARMTARPRLLSRLDEYQRSWRLYRAPGGVDLLRPAAPRLPAGGIDGLADRFDAGSRKPIAVAFASLSGDGRRREAAVRAIIAEPHPALIPFLVIRTGDWARQVREPARAGLAVLLGDRPDIYLPAAIPIAGHLAGRFRGAYAAAQVTATVLTAPGEMRRRLATSRSVLERRLAFDADRIQGRLSTADLAAIAMREPDSIIRSRATRIACSEAVWGRDAAALRGLAGARWSDVRAVALTGLVRLGLDAEVAELAMDDPAPLVRPLGRAAARRAGIDAEAHYRAAVGAWSAPGSGLGAVDAPGAPSRVAGLGAADAPGAPGRVAGLGGVGASPAPGGLAGSGAAGASPAPGSIAGLAEVGSASDAALLIPLLGHANAKVRAAAVRALAALTAVPVGEVVPLLQDPAAAVVREAAVALRPFFRLLPAGLAGELMADPRPEVRLAGYRLVGDQDAAVRFAAAVTLSRDAEFGDRGRQDVVRLAQWAATRWSYDGRSAREVLTSPGGPDPEAAVEAARPALGEITDSVLAALRGSPR